MVTKFEKLVKSLPEYSKNPASKTEREAMWDALTAEERKQLAESRVFIRFAKATGLLDDPFQHINQSPPKPDICAYIDGRASHFELGEIVDQGLAKSSADGQRLNRERNCKGVTGCTLSQIDPLDKMLTEKCTKHYSTDGLRLDLVLYYWRQGPYEETIYGYLNESHRDIEKRLRNSQFDKIWIFDWTSATVLWKIE